MNKDIRLSTSFWDHWKVIVLKTDLGLESVESLQRLWCFAACNKPSGVLSGMNVRAIEAASHWCGKPGALVAKLVEVSLIDETEDGYALHDWDDHQGYVVHSADRSKQAKKAAATRWNKKATKNADGNAASNAASNADSIPDSNPERNAPFPFPYPDPDPIAFFSAPASAAPAAPAKKEKKRAVISDGWQPEAGTLAIFAALAIPPDFAESCVPHFRLHHRESGTLAVGFESAFVGWVKRAWQDRPPPSESPPITERPRGVTAADWINHRARALLADDPIAATPALEVSRAH